MDYICDHGFTQRNYSPNRLHTDLWAMLHCSFYPFVLRISTEEPGRAEATQGWLHIIPLSSLGPYLHILWAVMKMRAVLFIKIIAALNCCGLYTWNGRREYS